MRGVATPAPAAHTPCELTRARRPAAAELNALRGALVARATAEEAAWSRVQERILEARGDSLREHELMHNRLTRAEVLVRDALEGLVKSTGGE